MRNYLGPGARVGLRRLHRLLHQFQALADLDGLPVAGVVLEVAELVAQALRASALWGLALQGPGSGAKMNQEREVTDLRRDLSLHLVSRATVHRLRLILLTPAVLAGQCVALSYFKLSTPVAFLLGVWAVTEITLGLLSE